MESTNIQSIALLTLPVGWPFSKVSHMIQIWVSYYSIAYWAHGDRALHFSDGANPCSLPRRFSMSSSETVIFDGTGSPWYAADIAIQNGRIIRIGALDEARARRVIDAKGYDRGSGLHRHARTIGTVAAG